MNAPIPTEAAEQAVVVQYCRMLGLRFFRVPNETYTKSWKQKNVNKMLGVSAGVPDLFVLPTKHKIIGIEMKRIKGSRTSEEQKEWVAALNYAGIQTRICKGAEEAIAFIDEMRGKEDEAGALGTGADT